MVNSHRAAAAAVALALLPGCAATAPSYLSPAGAGLQSISRTSAPTAGRVLYIADIDGQPGVGQIHVYQATMQKPQWIRDITTGTGRPFGMWVDDRNYLYVANITNKYPAAVTIFKPGGSTPIYTISKLKGQPEAVAVDAAHNVYVNENVGDAGIVEVFPPNSNTTVREIDTGVSGYAFNPGGMAFDPKGNLIVGEQAKLLLHVVRIAPGSTKATPLNLDLTNIAGPGLGMDKAGNLYIASGSGAQIAVYPPGHQRPSRFISQAGGYGFMTVTPEGAVYAANGQSSVAEVPPGGKTPANTLQCTCSAQGTAVSR